MLEDTTLPVVLARGPEMSVRVAMRDESLAWVIRIPFCVCLAQSITLLVVGDRGIRGDQRLQSQARKRVLRSYA